MSERPDCGKCFGIGYTLEHRENCDTSTWGECCLYRERYCDCADGTRLRAHDGAPTPAPPSTPSTK